MKQSTTFACVANKFSKVLQGYTKGIRFVAVLTVLLTMGIGQAWAETIYTNSGATGTTNGITASGSINANNGNAKPSFGLTSSSKNTITLTGLNLTSYTNVVMTFDYQLGKSGSSYSSLTVTQYNSNSVSISTNNITGSNNTSYKEATIALQSACTKITIVCKPASSSTYNTYVDNINITGDLASLPWVLKGSFDNWGDGVEMTEVSTGKATATLDLAANTQYEFKFVNGSNWLGNNGTINADISNWVFTSSDGNVKLNSGLGGIFTFTIDYSASTTQPKVSITYPRKDIYMACGDSWCDATPTFFAHAWRNGGTETYDVKLAQAPCESSIYITENIPAYCSHVIFTRQKPGSTQLVWSGENFWNQSEDITISTNNLFTCTGWNNNKGTFSGGTYTPPTYKITFSGNGNTGGSMSNVTGIPCDGSTTLVTNGYTRTGYTFNNWKTNVAVTANSSSVAANGSVANKATISNITSNITLTAQWKANTYTITLNGNNGSGHTTSVTATYNSATLSSAITNPTRTGYTFKGWYSSASGGSMVIGTNGKLQANVSGYTGANGIWTVTSGKTLYAQWTPITYQVKFNGNGSTSGSMSNQTFTYGTAQSLTANAFTRTDYKFAGWNTNADGSGTSYADKESVNNLANTDGTIVNLYAKWTKIHTITWMVNGEQYGKTQEVEDGQTIGSLPDAPDAPASCSDKVFMGWTESATVNNDGTSITYISTSIQPDGDKTYHAVFATEEEVPGGTVDTSTSVTISSYADGNSWKDATAYTSVTLDECITASASKGTNTGKYYENGENWRFYQNENAQLTISAATGCTIKTVKVTYTPSNNGVLKYNGTNVSSGSIVTVNAASAIFSVGNTGSATNGQVRVTKIEVTYSKPGGTTTDYTDYVTSCTPQYTITLNPNGGTIDDDHWIYDNGTGYYTQTVSEGTVLNLPTPTHANNYEFVGWNDGADNHIGNYAATSDVTLTAQWQCIPPTSVTVDGTYHFFPGETITLTATPTGGSTPYTYQWQKLVVDEWQDIDQATSATYTKANATKEDVGHYQCVVSSGNSCETVSGSYDVKCLQLYVYYDDHTDNFNLPLTKVDATTATTSVNLVNQNYTYKFKLTDGCENWYGNTGTMTSGDCTNWEMNANEYCGLKTTKYGDYLFTVDYSNLALLKVSVTYPSGNQEAGKVIYWDNHDLQWPDGKIYYRIGHSTHNGKIAMTKVPGTANLYQVTTIEYAGFEAWHIANNGCWSEDNSIYKTNTGDEWAATAATAFITNPVTSSAVTVTPSNLHSTGGEEQNSNCEFYQYDIAGGMKKHNAEIIASPTGGTITVSYTDHDGTAKSDFTSGDRDLAHTCLLTITATPDAGYSLGTLTVNDVPFTSGNVHTLAEDAVIEVVWEKKQDVTLAWSAPTCTVTIASLSNEFPTLTVTPEAVKSGVKYESSNTTIATIDANGNIILKSAGTSTIKAYYVEDATYAAAEDTYELIVEESDNCRWEEVTIDDIEYGDEVVIGFRSENLVYMLQDPQATANPKVYQMNLNNLVNSTNLDNTLIWNIRKCDDNQDHFTIYKKGSTADRLAFISNYGVRVGGNNADSIFTLTSEGYVKSIKSDEYLKMSASNDWRHYSTSPSQSFVFYKRVCLPEGQYRVTWMVNGQEYTEGNPTTVVNEGNRVADLPTIPDDYKLTGCSSKKFIGWTTEEILEETDEAPIMFTDVASSPVINSNQIFHAVFADEEEGEVTYEKVTSISEGTYLMATTSQDIYITKSTLAYTGKSTHENRGGVTAVTISNGVISEKPELAKEIIVTLGAGSNANYFAMFDGDYYITQTEKNKFTFASNISYEWSLNANGQIKQKSVYDGKDDIRIYMNNGNSGTQSEFFAPYAAKNEGNNNSSYYYHAYLFKKVGGTSYSGYITQCCTPWDAPTLSANPTSVSSSYGTTQITCSGTTHGNVTYTSSNEYIAGVAVNSSGKVIVTGRNPGYVTITATWDGVDGAGNYCPAESSIDITVTGSFKITYDANHANATGSTAATTIAFPTGDGNVASNGFALAGHEFVKWNTAADGTGTSYKAGDAITLTDNITLYAIWQPNQYDITVNVVGGSVKLGSTTITTQQTIADVVAHGQSFSFTNPTPDVAYTTNYTVTLNSGTADVTSNLLTVSNVQSDLNITITFTAKPTYTVTYVVPAEDGRTVAPTSIYEGGSVTMPGITGEINSDYSCEELIGWTTQATYENANGQKPNPFYAIGANFSGITQNTTLYAVYSRAGNGAGGTVTLTTEEMQGWSVQGSYGIVRDLTTCHGTWTTNGIRSTGNPIQLKNDGTAYVKFPELQGNITQVVLDVTNGSGNSLNSGTLTLKTGTDANATTIATGSISNSTCTINVSGSYKTAYLSSNTTARITNISISYGPAAIISTNLKCTNDYDECTITYDLNESFLPTGTTVYGACADATFLFSEIGTYTICASPKANEHQLLGWNNQCDGKGSLTYTPGQEITSLPQNIITLYAQWAPEVIVHDSYEETKVYPTAMGGSIALNSGQYACDPKKYDFIGWTTDDPQLWQQNITPPTLLADNGDGSTTFTPEEPSQVYAVYAIEDLANSDAFKLSSIVDGKKYYAKYNANRTGHMIATTEVAEALTFGKEQSTGSTYKIFFVNPNGEKEYIYSNGDLQTSSAPSETWAWTISGTAGNYTFTSAYGDGKCLSTNGNNFSVVLPENLSVVFDMEVSAEYKYIAKTNCSENVTITFVPGNGTMTPNINPVTAKTGDIITLPTCEYEGWIFEGWVTENIELTEFRVNPSRLYTETYEVGNSDVTLYAYYTQTPTPADFDGTTSGTWKMYTEVSTDVYKYALSHGSSSPNTLSSTEYCPNATEWTFTNTGEANVYYIQDEDNLYLTPEPDNTQLYFTSTPFPWKIVKIADSDGYRIYKYDTRSDDYNRLIMSNSNGLFYHSAKINEKNSYWYHVTIGGCTNPVYTTDPQPSKIISLVGSPMITSTIEQTVKASQKLQLVIKDMDANADVTIAADGLTFYDTDNNVVNNLQTGSNGSLTATFTVAYTPTVADNQIVKPTITITCGSTVRTFYNVSCRSLPADFAIVAKVGNMWYALPSQGLNSTDALVGYPVEVDNQNDPTAVTAVPDNADWSLRQVYAGQNANATKDRFKQYGANIMFENNASPAKMLNASVSYNYLLTDAQYANYYETNPGLYEWTPTTTDLETYTLTNAQRTAITLNVATNTVFGVHAQNVATNNLRFLPIDDRYTPLALQVVEWKENSIVIMYNGDPAQTASVSVNGGAAQTTTLSDAKRDIAVYELTATGLAANPTQRLSITIGTEKLLLPIPYIVNSNTTDATLTSNNKTLAAVSDLVVLNGKTLTADAATASKYTFRNVTIYGGGSLIIPSGKGLGVNSLTMRVGAVVDDNYQNLYPSMLLAGTINTGNINIDYLTTADYYYPLSVPEQVTIADIKYPVDIYGNNVKANNTGSFQLKYYDGAQRVAHGSQYGTGWRVVDENTTTTLTPNQGYAIWGIPKKINGTRQTYGIHRIPIKKAANDLVSNEMKPEEIQVYAYGDASTPPNDRGWNYLGNPYLAGLGGMNGSYSDLQMGLLVQEIVDGKWTGGWVNNGDQVRYITLTNDCQNFEALPVADATIPAFTTFFIQAAQDGAIALSAPATIIPSSVAARHYAAQQDATQEITTGIILTGNDQTDRTGLLIADHFTEKYDYNADLSKFENSGINLYTIGKDGKLAFMAINQALAEQPIPLGYGAPADGEYTIAFDEERYNATDISALYLIDYDSHEKTNLLHTDYSFVTAAGTNNQRFALQVAFAPANATNIEWIDDATVQVGMEGNTLLLYNLPTDAAVQVFDALGRLMYHAPTVPTDMQLTLPTGYYLVRIANKQHTLVIDTLIP